MCEFTKPPLNPFRIALIHLILIYYLKIVISGALKSIPLFSVIENWLHLTLSLSNNLVQMWRYLERWHTFSLNARKYMKHSSSIILSKSVSCSNISLKVSSRAEEWDNSWHNGIMWKKRLLLSFFKGEFKKYRMCVSVRETKGNSYIQVLTVREQVSDFQANVCKYPVCLCVCVCVCV